MIPNLGVQNPSWPYLQPSPPSGHEASLFNDPLAAADQLADEAGRSVPKIDYLELADHPSSPGAHQAIPTEVIKVQCSTFTIFSSISANI